MKFRLIAKKILTLYFVILAKAILARYKPKIVVITGSVGKTSTKSALYAVLRHFVSVRKNEIQGNAWGIALTIIGGNTETRVGAQVGNIFKSLLVLIFKGDYPAWLILELACQKPGDLDEVLPWLAPDVVIITYFGLTPPHIEFFKSREHLISEKLSILSKLKKDGFVIWNIDDPNLNYVKEKITFGLKSEANISGSNIQVVYREDFPDGLNFRINYGGNSVPIHISKALGNNHIYAFLAAFAFASKQHFNMITASQAAENYNPPWGRMKLVEGEKGTLIIDDTYNSSPNAVEEALNSLSQIKVPGRKIAVLGDMLELGRDTHDAHKQIGELAAKSVDYLITVGFRAQGFGEGALGFLDSGKIAEFEDIHKAGKFLENLIKPGDIILIKGSRPLHLEEIVEEIKAVSRVL